jgi:hypothetical protein
MRIIALLFIVLTTLVTRSMGQTGLPKFYCQGCCGGIGVYYLKLDLATKFELYYSTGDKTKDAFGLGTFNIKNDILSLSFENIPQDGIDLRKINSSDSLIIHFNVFDNVRADSVPSLNVKFKSRGTVFYPNPTGTIRIRFSGPEIINFSSLGFRDISYSLAEPGEYEMKVRLNPEGATYLKQGDKREFKIVRANEIEWFQDLGNKKLKFTTKSCRH